MFLPLSFVLDWKSCHRPIFGAKPSGLTQCRGWTQWPNPVTKPGDQTWWMNPVAAPGGITWIVLPYPRSYRYWQFQHYTVQCMYRSYIESPTLKVIVGSFNIAHLSKSHIKNQSWQFLHWTPLPSLRKVLVYCVNCKKMFRISAHSSWGSATSFKQNIAIDQQNSQV